MAGVGAPLRRSGDRRAGRHTARQLEEADGAAWIKSYDDAGARHILLRFSVDNERLLYFAARIWHGLVW